MSRGSGRTRVRSAASDWTVPDRNPEPADVDERLRKGSGRTGRLQVLIDHDNPGSGRCPGCGWIPTTRSRDCPSRVLALCLLDRRPVPAWLAHLTGDIPGARPRRCAVSEDERRADDDALPGLFDPPPRTRPGGEHG